MSDTTPETAVEKLAAALYADGELGPGYMLREDCEHLARRVLASGVVVPAGETVVLTEDEREAISEAVWTWEESDDQTVEDHVLPVVARIVAARTPARDDLAARARAVVDRWTGVVERCADRTPNGTPCDTCVARGLVIEDFRRALLDDAEGEL